MLFPSNNLKRKKNKINREVLRCHCFISTIVKHPLYVKKKTLQLSLSLMSCYIG